MRKMRRATPEYKQKMREIRKKVRLEERSEKFRKVRALLKGQHQDMLETVFVKALEQNPNTDFAEKKAIQEIVRVLPTPGLEHHCGESLRLYEYLTGVSRECLANMHAAKVLDKISQADIW